MEIAPRIPSGDCEISMSDTTLIGIILCAFTYCAAWWHETTYEPERFEPDFPRAWVIRG